MPPEGERAGGRERVVRVKTRGPRPSRGGAASYGFLDLIYKPSEPDEERGCEISYTHTTARRASLFARSRSSFFSSPAVRPHLITKLEISTLN